MLSLDLAFFELKPLPTAINLLPFLSIEDAKEYFSTAVEKYSLASSIDRNGRRLIAVGSGFNSKNARSKESTKLLTFGLTNYDLVEIAN